MSEREQKYAEAIYDGICSVDPEEEAVSDRRFPCCEHCPEDTIFHEDNPPDSHEIECPTCERARLRAEALPELAEARAEIERLRDEIAHLTRECLDREATEMDRASRLTAYEPSGGD